MKYILLMGRPGSGKGTHGTAFAGNEDANALHVSMGDVVRQHLDNKPEPRLLALMKAGQLLPDSDVQAILTAHLSTLEREQHVAQTDKVILLDGYPRTQAQYKMLLNEIGRPLGVIHTDCPCSVAEKRLNQRVAGRIDDNFYAIKTRLADYEQLTAPLILQLKTSVPYRRIDTDGTREQTLADFSLAVNEIERNVKSCSLWQALSTYWHGSGDITQFRDKVNQRLGSRNFLISSFPMAPICFLETKEAVTKVLRATSTYGSVYQQFARAADLSYDFTAMHNSSSTSDDRNVWPLLRKAFASASQGSDKHIQRLITRNIGVLFAKQTFDLEQQFDTFFSALWCQYLFGESINSSPYAELKTDVLHFMQHCFYQNRLKAFDKTGLSSFLYALPRSSQLAKMKARIRDFIANAEGGFVQRFKAGLVAQSEKEGRPLSAQLLAKIVEDNVFDLLFIPDFLQGALYETLRLGIKNKLDFSDEQAVETIYQKGLKQSYLFPYRTRVLKEDVRVDKDTILHAGTTTVLSIKKAGLYHSAGPRMCAGIAFTRYFKQHFFAALKHIDFSLVKSRPNEAKVQRLGDENVPVTTDSLQVKWALKRASVQNTIHYHNYKGQRFYDVLELNEKPLLRELIVQQMVQSIKARVKLQGLELADIVIAAPALRGLPIASIVASRLSVPFFTLRKEGGYKMVDAEIYTVAYDKGYGETDSLELPRYKHESLNGKTVFLIDDGVASGESLLAAKELCLKCGANINIVAYSMIKHDYAVTNAALAPLETLFDFKKEPVNAAVLPFFNVRQRGKEAENTPVQAASNTLLQRRA